MSDAPVVFNLVLVGFGHVARAFVRLLADRAGRLERSHHLSTRIVGISTWRHGALLAPRGLDGIAAASAVERGERLEPSAADQVAALNTLDLLARVGRTAWSSPLVVMETTTLDVERGEPALSHLLAAFDAGAHVITANKGPIACAWSRVRDGAARAHRHVLFEGVVMDGIPVFNLVRETLPAVTITRLRGIVNTTTNYVLAALEEGREAADALREMQERGTAEADASLDIEGWDAAAKAAALANVLMDASMTPAQVSRTGIAHLTAADAAAARGAGCTLKLVMEVARGPHGVTASVAPVRLPPTDPLAQVAGSMNALTISTDCLDDITVTQHGSSIVDTAYALLADLVTLQRRLRRRR
jgi:homoserine dehydrogenase